MQGKSLALFLAFGVLLSACESEGPAERAGEQIDQAVESAGEKVEEAADSAGESIENATDSAGGAIEKAGDTIREKTD